MPLSSANPEFVRQELGDLDDLEVAEIVALGASETEVLQARAWLASDENALQSLCASDAGPSPKVRQILDIARTADDAIDPG